MFGKKSNSVQKKLNKGEIVTSEEHHTVLNELDDLREELQEQEQHAKAAAATAQELQKQLAAADQGAEDAETSLQVSQRRVSELELRCSAAEAHRTEAVSELEGRLASRASELEREVARAKGFQEQLDETSSQLTSLRLGAAAGAAAHLEVSALKGEVKAAHEAEKLSKAAIVWRDDLGNKLRSEVAELRKQQAREAEEASASLKVSTTAADAKHAATESAYRSEVRELEEQRHEAAEGARALAETRRQEAKQGVLQELESERRATRAEVGELEARVKAAVAQASADARHERAELVAEHASALDLARAGIFEDLPPFEASEAPAALASPPVLAGGVSSAEEVEELTEQLCSLRRGLEERDDEAAELRSELHSAEASAGQRISSITLGGRHSSSPLPKSPLKSPAPALAAALAGLSVGGGGESRTAPTGAEANADAQVFFIGTPGFEAPKAKSTSSSSSRGSSVGRKAFDWHNISHPEQEGKHAELEAALFSSESVCAELRLEVAQMLSATKDAQRHSIAERASDSVSDGLPHYISELRQEHAQGTTPLRERPSSSQEEVEAELRQEIAELRRGGASRSFSTTGGEEERLARLDLAEAEVSSEAAVVEELRAELAGHCARLFEENADDSSPVDTRLDVRGPADLGVVDAIRAEFNTRSQADDAMRSPSALLEEELARSERDADEFRESHEELRKELATAEAGRSNAASAADAAWATHTSLRDEVGAAEAAAEEFETRAGELLEELESSGGAHSLLESRLEGLASELQAEHEATLESHRERYDEASAGERALFLAASSEASLEASAAQGRSQQLEVSLEAAEEAHKHAIAQASLAESSTLAAQASLELEAARAEEAVAEAQAAEAQAAEAQAAEAQAAQAVQAAEAQAAQAQAALLEGRVSMEQHESHHHHEKTHAHHHDRRELQEELHAARVDADSEKEASDLACAEAKREAAELAEKLDDQEYLLMLMSEHAAEDGNGTEHPGLRDARRLRQELKHMEARLDDSEAGQQELVKKLHKHQTKTSFALDGAGCDDDLDETCEHPFGSDSPEAKLRPRRSRDTAAFGSSNDDDPRDLAETVRGLRAELAEESRVAASMREREVLLRESLSSEASSAQALGTAGTMMTFAGDSPNRGRPSDHSTIAAAAELDDDDDDEGNPFSVDGVHVSGNPFGNSPGSSPPGAGGGGAKGGAGGGNPFGASSPGCNPGGVGGANPFAGGENEDSGTHLAADPNIKNGRHFSPSPRGGAAPASPRTPRTPRDSDVSAAAAGAAATATARFADEAARLREALESEEAVCARLRATNPGAVEVEKLRSRLEEESKTAKRLCQYALEAEASRRILLQELSEESEAEAELTSIARLVGRAAVSIASVARDGPLLKTVLTEALAPPQLTTLPRPQALPEAAPPKPPALPRTCASSFVSVTPAPTALAAKPAALAPVPQPVGCGGLSRLAPPPSLDAASLM